MKVLGFLIVFLSANLTNLAFGQNPVRLYKPTLGITPELVPDYRVKAGENAEFKGNICLLKRHPVHADKTRCHKLIDEDQFAEYEIKFFFPDTNSEVTEKVNLSQTTKGVDYHFTSLEVKKEDLNRFTVLVQKKGAKPEAFLNTQAKFEKHIQLISKRVRELEEKTDDLDALNKLKKLQATLQKVKDKVVNKVIDEPEVWARLDHPVQVENNIMPPVEYFSIVSGMKLWMQVPLGVAIEGETTKIRARVTNLKQADNVLDEYEDEQYFKRKWRYKGELIWNGSVVASEEKLLSGGQMFEFEHQTGPLLPIDLNKVHLLVTRSKEVPSHAASYQMLQNQGWGDISYSLDVQSDATVPRWSNQSIIAETQYFQNYPVLDIQAEDEFGRLKKSSIKVQANADLVSGSTNSLNFLPLMEVTAKDQVFSSEYHGIEDGANVYQMVGNLNPLEEGLYTLTAEVESFNGVKAQPQPLTRSFRIDRTAPQLTVAQTDNQLTNNPTFDLPISVVDDSPVTVRIIHNGKLVAEHNNDELVHPLALEEGSNSIEVSAEDAAGNTSEIYSLNIRLDTTPPELESITPESGTTILGSTKVNVSGKASEELARVLVNGNEAIIENGKNFRYELETLKQGEYTYNVELYDHAGNKSNYSKTIKLLFSILNKNLITIVPAQRGDRLKVVGSAGASMPGIQVNAYSSYFNSDSIYSNQDGSFEIILDYFESVEISAEDPSSGKSTNFTLTFNADTTLIGQIKDTSGNPLPGVKVLIFNSGQTATTDIAGTFQISTPPFGDQKITIDPTNMPPEIIGEGRKFFKTAISYNVGRTQRNQLPTIYLSSLILDGTETQVSETGFTRVTSPHAPGVELGIQAGAASFPDGKKSGAINISYLDANKLTIPTPSFAKPTQVINLEPSGVTFSEPVEVVLPNDNNFPPGIDVIILSKNSATGSWEADGVAQVSDNGSEIRTKPNMGLTHFSDIFAVPILPELKQFKSGDRPGVSVTENALTREITLPSYKSLGKDIAPKLIYKSTWAKPNAIVKHSFDYKYKKIERTEDLSYSSQGFDIDERQFIESWTGPSAVDFKFSIGNQESEPGRFVGVPYRTVVSYSFDLSNFDSGIYPYMANFAIHFSNLTLITRNISGEKEETVSYLFGLLKKTFVTKLEPFQETLTEKTVIGQVIPQDILGPVYLQNKTDSSYGKGWMLSGIPSIVNTIGPRVMVEEGDGNVSTYNLNNTITTLFEDDEGISAASLQTYPSIVYSDGHGNIKSITETTDEPVEVGTLPKYEGRYRFNAPGIIINGQPRDCYFVDYDMEVSGNAVDFFPLGFNSYLATDGLNGVVKISDNGVSYIAGGKGRLPDLQSSDLFGWFFRDIGDFNVTSGGSSKCSGDNATGTIPVTGNVNGTLSASNFSAPRGITELSSNVYLIADSGNGLIRKLDLNTNQVTTFAGRGANRDDGNGGFAIDAGIFKPKSIAVGNSGNIYFSSEKGFIRRIDATGRIYHVAGKNISEGGEFLDSTSIDKVNFESPSGIAYDKINDELYVADTGHNRIVRLSFNTNRADVVAGNGSCSDTEKSEENALEASLCAPTQLYLDADQNLIFLDSANNKIKKLIFNSVSGTQNTFISSKEDGSSLTRFADGSWERKYRSGDSVFFNDKGQITTVKTKDGKTTTYTYSNGQLDQIVDPVNNVTSFAYDFDGKLISITDPTGQTTNFNINENNELVGVTFADSTTKQFIYDNGLLIEEFNQNHDKKIYEYNKYSRLIKVIEPDGSFKEFYNEEDRTLANEFTDLTQDPGELQGYGEGEAQLSMNIYDSNGNHYQIIPGKNGLAQRIINPDGTEIEFEYDENDRIKKKINSDKSFVSYSYNNFGDIVDVYSSSTDSLVSMEYDASGRLIKQIDPKGGITKYSYDNSTGWLTKIKNNLSHETVYTYNDLGLVTSTTNHLGFTQTMEYDLYGNISRLISHNSDITSYTRDIAGNIIEQVNPNGAVTKYSFDLWNRLLAVEDEKGGDFNYSYDDIGNLVSQSNSSYGLSTFEYDSMNRPVKTVTATGQVYESIYDSNGNVIQVIDPAGQLINFEYDIRNRLIKKTLPDDQYIYSYDDDNNLTFISNNVSEIEMDYAKVNGQQVLTRITTKGKGALSGYLDNTIINNYDLNGNRISAETAVGNFVYSYDSLNQLTSIINHKGEVTNFHYDEAQRLFQVDNLGTSRMFDIDGSGNLMRIEYKRGSSILNFFAFERDSAGNRTKITTPRGVSTLTYDPQNMLIAQSNPEISGMYSSETFSYDVLGNRVTDQSKTYSYDANKRKLIEDDSFSYHYDLNGNLVKKVSKENNSNFLNYTYDSENRLILVEKIENSNKVYSEEYFYDALGRRLKTIYVENENIRESKYLYDGDEVLAEVNENNEVMFIYTHSNLQTDDVLTVDVSSQAVSDGRAFASGSFKYIKDGIGSIIDIIDSAGNLVQHHVYSSFGKLLDIKDSSGSSIKNNPKVDQGYYFANREYSTSLDLSYNRARTYSPEIGRFLQEDSYSGDPSLPISVFNKYTYALNNPVSFTDPSGNCPWCIWAGIAVLTYVGTELEGYFNDDAPRDDSFYYVGVNFNTSGEFDSFTVGAGSGDASFYYNLGENYENWVFHIQQDMRGISSVYPEMYLLGYYGLPRLTSAAGVGFRGGEIVLSNAAGKTYFRLAPLGHGRSQGATSNPWYRRAPHYHRRVPDPNNPGQSLPGQGIGQHRPWQGGF